MNDVLRVLNIDNREYDHTIAHLYQYSKASVAAFKLNLVRKVLNLGRKMSFKGGAIWYPYTPALLPNSLYRKDDYEVEVAKVKIGCDTFTLLGGHAYDGTYEGLGIFTSHTGIAHSDAVVNFLGCATKEIARHMGKYFAREIFEAKYGDTIEYKWV